MFLTASALALKILAISSGILGVAGFGIGLFYNGIGDYYRKKHKFYGVSLLRKTIFKPKQKNKENDINLKKEEKENNLINEDEDVIS